MAKVTILWEYSDQEKSSDPFCVDGSVEKELVHMNELAILFGRAASNFCEKDIEINLLPPNTNIFFSSKELGPKNKKSEDVEVKTVDYLN